MPKSRIHTLICSKPAAASSSLLDLTAWKAVQTSISFLTTTIRVHRNTYEWGRRWQRIRNPMQPACGWLWPWWCNWGDQCEVRPLKKRRRKRCWLRTRVVVGKMREVSISYLGTYYVAGEFRNCQWSVVDVSPLRLLQGRYGGRRRSENATLILRRRCRLILLSENHLHTEWSTYYVCYLVPSMEVS